MRLTAFVAGIAAALVLLACPEPPQDRPGTSSRATPTAAAAAPPERVVLITIDTLRADYVGAYGAERVRTGTLDAIAAEGVLFEVAIAPAPLTLPSHASLMTGLDPPLHGVHSNVKFRLEEGIPTLAQRFHAAGFTTAAFVGAVVLDRRYGLDLGFDIYEDEMGFRRSVPDGGGYAERTAAEVLDETIAWLETAPKRFFLWVHLFDPHANYQPPPEFLEGGEHRIDLATTGLLEAFAAAGPPAYAGEISYADAELKRFMHALRQRWSDGRTLIVATSDHGESLGEHGELTHSLTLYDATQRIPLLMAGPGIPRGRVVTTPVRLVDVAPTILAAAGLPPLPRASGRDLGPWIRGEEESPLVAYIETLVPELDYGWSPLFGLRTQRYKYLRGVRPELYDLVEDPQETRNLAAEQPSLVSQLDALLEECFQGALPVHPNAVTPPEERELLESLGYVVASPPDPLPPLGQVQGPDSRVRIGAVVQLAEARSHLAAGRPKRALELLSSVPAAGGWVALTRAKILIALGQPEEAEREVRKTIAVQPQYPEGFLILGQALVLQQRSDDARAAYREALRVDPTSSAALLALGRLAEAEKDRAAAAVLYQQALEGRAPNADAGVRLVALRFEEGRVEEARELLKRLRGHQRISIESMLRLARAEAAAGYRDSALQRLAWLIRNKKGGPAVRAAFEEIRDQP